MRASSSSERYDIELKHQVLPQMPGWSKLYTYVRASSTSVRTCHIDMQHDMRIERDDGTAGGGGPRAGGDDEDDEAK